MHRSILVLKSTTMSKLRSNLQTRTKYSIITVALSVTLFIIATITLSKPFTIITTAHHHCKIETSHFALTWIHSVDKTPWVEFYTRIDEGFLLTRTQFRTFGAGVPHEGRVLESHNGMIHYQMDQYMPEINWVIDRDVRSSILINNDLPWKIYEETDRYSEVQIRNESLNFWQRLTMRNCHESPSI